MRWQLGCCAFPTAITAAAGVEDFVSEASRIRDAAEPLTDARVAGASSPSASASSPSLAATSSDIWTSSVSNLLCAPAGVYAPSCIEDVSDAVAALLAASCGCSAADVADRTAVVVLPVVESIQQVLRVWAAALAQCQRQMLEPMTTNTTSRTVASVSSRACAAQSVQSAGEGLAARCALSRRCAANFALLAAVAIVDRVISLLSKSVVAAAVRVKRSAAEIIQADRRRRAIERASASTVMERRAMAKAL